MRLFAIIATLGLAFSVHASRADTSHSTTVYRVKPGDTLQLIAAEYYGDRNKSIFIMVENKITHPKPLRPGERLRIPLNREITTNPDDTWESLAGAYLGDPRRAPFLAEFNNKTSQETIPAGTTLNVPVTVTHTADATETLANISAAYFGETKHAEMLRRYNFRQKMSLEKGETLIVPAFHVRLQASKLPPPDADAKKRQALRIEAAGEAATAVPKAWQAWRAGDYADIENLLLNIEVEFVDVKYAADVQLLLGLAHTAEGKTDLALEDFKKVLARRPDHVLRRFDYSPKILEIWEKAGGKSE